MERVKVSEDSLGCQALAVLWCTEESHPQKKNITQPEMLIPARCKTPDQAGWPRSSHFDKGHQGSSPKRCNVTRLLRDRKGWVGWGVHPKPLLVSVDFEAWN